MTDREKANAAMQHVMKHGKPKTSAESLKRYMIGNISRRLRAGFSCCLAAAREEMESTIQGAT